MNLLIACQPLSTKEASYDTERFCGVAVGEERDVSEDRQPLVRTVATIAAASTACNFRDVMCTASPHTRGRSKCA